MTKKKFGGGKRRKGHDYTRGGYFVTIVTYERRHLLSRIARGRVFPTAVGAMVIKTFGALATQFANVECNDFQCMPEHVHGITWLKPQLAGAPRAKDLSHVMQRFKSLTTYLFIQGARVGLWSMREPRLWQKGFYDIWIRDASEGRRIKRYIRDNPKKWEPQIAYWSEHGLDRDG